MELDDLSHFPESTVFGWAMNLDGFISFLAKVATAMRATAAAGREKLVRLDPGDGSGDRF